MKGTRSPKHKTVIWRIVALAVILFSAAVATTNPTSASTDDILPSIVRGGRLYDNWYKEAAEPAPTERHPAYPSDMTYANAPESNWRCTECHGWDYLGRNGTYSQGKHFTGIKGIRGMAGADPAVIIAVLKDERHGYTGLLDEYDLRDLANFVSLGQIDMDKFIDRSTKLAKGDPEMREAHYKTICAACHGKHGLKMTTMPPLGMIARNNPWEALHKILNGHPDEHMPALRALDKAVLVDILAFIQTLPEER